MGPPEKQQPEAGDISDSQNKNKNIYLYCVQNKCKLKIQYAGWIFVKHWVCKTILYCIYIIIELLHLEGILRFPNVGPRLKKWNK